MTGLVRKAMLLGVCGLMAAAVVSADVPDPAHSTVPKYIKVVGTHGSGIPDAAGHFTIVVRDFAGNAISNCNVQLNFSACCDTRLCTIVVAGQTLNQCSPPVVSAVTAPDGSVSFTVVGGGTDPGLCPSGSTTTPGAGVGCVAITACGYPLGNATAVIFDVNGAVVSPTGVNGGDLSVVLNNVGYQGLHSGAYRGRCDYSAGTQITDPVINGADIASYLPILGSAGLGTGSGSGCPSSAYCAGASCPGGSCKNP